jgi:protein SCO1/2
MKSIMKYRILGIFLSSPVSLYLFVALKPTKTFIFNPSDVNPELVDSTVQYSKYHTIADFSFVNQNGKTITQKRL